MMAPKDAKPGKGGKHKGKNEPSPVSTPPLLITNEKLAHPNWWPVISMVVENSPVETLLVDLVADKVKGNSVVVIKKDDLLQEAKRWLEERDAPVTPDANLSRREVDKNAKKQAAEENARKREQEDKEREAARLKQEKQAQDRLTTVNNSNASMTKQLAKSAVVRGSTDKAGSVKNETPQIVPDPAATPEPAPSRPRTLVDDLFDELSQHNKDKSFEEILKEPSPLTLALLIKYKILLLKRFDMQLFRILYPERGNLDSPMPSPLESKVSFAGKKFKDPKAVKAAGTEKDLLSVAKDAKISKAPTLAKLSVLPKDPKAAGGSILKMKAGGKKGISEDPGDNVEPPVLPEGEVIREAAHVEVLTQDHKGERARARARSEIPSPIAKIIKKQRTQSQAPAEDDVDIQEGQHGVPPGDGVGTFGPGTAADMFDEMVNPQDDMPYVDQDASQQMELYKLRQLLLASIMGTEGLPVLNHSLSTNLGLYGLPTFPAFKYQMTRHIVLQGFRDSAIILEMNRTNSPPTCVVNVQYMRHRRLSPLKLSTLLWIHNPAEQAAALEKFWADVRVLSTFDPKAAAPPLTALVLQVKYDVTVATTKSEVELVANDAGETLANLIYYVVRAKILFQFYNESLDLQRVPANKHSKKGSKEHPVAGDMYGFLQSLKGRATARRKSPEKLALSIPAENPLPEMVQQFMQQLESDLYLRGLLSEIRSDRQTSVDTTDMSPTLTDTPTHSQLSTLTKFLGAELQTERCSLPRAQDGNVNSVLHKALNNRDIELQYLMQWIEKLLEVTADKTASAPRKTPEEKEPINALAEAMLAWNIGVANLPKSVPVRETDYEFLVPEFSEQTDVQCPETRLEQIELQKLSRLTSYYAVVSYAPNKLMAHLSDASEQFFHRCIKEDETSRKTFFIFYALHDKISHLHVRHAETRMHSKADFPTFVCNIMDDIQKWTDSNIEKTYVCPQRPSIDPRFPYGCQSQLAYDRNFVQQLSSPETDHMAYFTRQHSLKNLVRLNKEIFAKRCGWIMKPVLSPVPPVPETPPTSPQPEKHELLTPEPTGKKKKPSAVKKPATEKAGTPEKLPPCPPYKKSAEEEPFIWNRATNPLVPPCDQFSLPKISAYGLTNALTKANREEERIYCPDMIVSVDRHELFDGTTALYITANITDELDVFLNNDKAGRGLCLEYDEGVRVAFELTNDATVTTLYDPRGTKTVILRNDTIACEICEVDSGKKLKSASPKVLFRNGAVSYFDEEGKPVTFLPNGNLIKNTTPDETSEPSAPEKALTEYRYVSGDGNTAASVNEAGIQTATEFSLSGAERRVQTKDGLRLITRYHGDGGSYAKQEVVMEKQQHPRIGMDKDGEWVWVALDGGVLLMCGKDVTVIFLGVNVMAVKNDGMAYLTKLARFCEAAQEPGMEGLKGYASARFLAFAKRILKKPNDITEWLEHVDWTKFCLSGGIVASVTDLSGTRHDIYDNGDVHRELGENPDFANMPNPRMFVVDETTGTGSEFLLGDEAVALKYKILEYYAPERVQSVTNGSKRSSRLCFRVSDKSAKTWAYERPNIMPPVLVSETRGFSGGKANAQFSEQKERFRGSEVHNVDQDVSWTVEFVPTKPKRGAPKPSDFYVGPCTLPYIIPAEVYPYKISLECEGCEHGT